MAEYRIEEIDLNRIGLFVSHSMNDRFCIIHTETNSKSGITEMIRWISNNLAATFCNAFNDDMKGEVE